MTSTVPEPIATPATPVDSHFIKQTVGGIEILVGFSPDDLRQVIPLGFGEGHVRRLAPGPVTSARLSCRRWTPTTRATRSPPHPAPDSPSRNLHAATHGRRPARGPQTAQPRELFATAGPADSSHEACPQRDCEVRP